MSALVPFHFESHQVRVVEIEGESWFVLADLADALGIARKPSALSERLDDDVRQTYPIIDSLGRRQTTIIVSEPGMYEVITTSRSPQAKPFKRWVFGEVLPQIRKTGTYGHAPALEGKHLLAAAVLEAQSVIASQEKQIEAADRYIAEIQPKADYVDLYVTDDDLLTIRQVAKSLGAQEKAVRAALLEHDWIYQEHSTRWSEKDQRKVDQYRYSPRAHKRQYFRTVQRHEAPRFKGQVDHTLKITPAGAKAIGLALMKWGVLTSEVLEVA